MQNGAAEAADQKKDFLSGFALLPNAPAQICFDKSEFMRDDYKVEQFVSDCRRRVPLEKLRDDLEQYFRLLKTAMVDLINKVSVGDGLRSFYSTFLFRLYYTL